MSYAHCLPCSQKQCWLCEGMCECMDCAYNINPKGNPLDKMKEVQESLKEKHKLLGGYTT